MTPNPVGVGWERGTDDKLEIKWTSLLPAPEEILDLLSCDCHRECIIETCICLANDLNCTDACHACHLSATIPVIARMTITPMTKMTIFKD